MFMLSKEIWKWNYGSFYLSINIHKDFGAFFCDTCFLNKFTTSKKQFLLNFILIITSSLEVKNLAENV